MKYELELEPGRVVVFRELSGEEFESVYKAAEASNTVGYELTQNCLRRALVSDGGEALSYKDLAGAQLAQRFRTRHLMMLRQAFESVHLPGAEDDARVRSMRAIADD